MPSVAWLIESRRRLPLFERVVDLMRLAPDARIAFNTTPADTAEAVQRWVASEGS